jgi:hypothetical protein
MLVKGSIAMMLFLALHAHPARPDRRSPAAAPVLVCDPEVAAGLRPLDRRAASEHCPQPFTITPESP